MIERYLSRILQRGAGENWPNHLGQGAYDPAEDAQELGILETTHGPDLMGELGDYFQDFPMFICLRAYVQGIQFSDRLQNLLATYRENGEEFSPILPMSQGGVQGIKVFYGGMGQLLGGEAFTGLILPGDTTLELAMDSPQGLLLQKDFAVPNTPKIEVHRIVSTQGDWEDVISGKAVGHWNGQVVFAGGGYFHDNIDLETIAPRYFSLGPCDGNTRIYSLENTSELPFDTTSLGGLIRRGASHIHVVHEDGERLAYRSYGYQYNTLAQGQFDIFYKQEGGNE